MGIFHIWVTTLTFLRYVTSSVTWPFDFSGAISYRCSVVTESLSPTIFEIIGIFHIWVTTLTFLGQVTSLVTWPIDPPYAISYWCPIVTEPLSLTVFEIFGPQYPCAHTHTQRHTETRRKWFYILSHAMYCIGQTMTNMKSHKGFPLTPRSMTLDDLGLYKFEFSVNLLGFRRFQMQQTTAKRMKIGQYCQRQRCKHVELEQFWHAFASHGFASDSWAFLLDLIMKS